MIVIRTYISNLPEALVESARIDGAGDFRIFWQIIFPLQAGACNSSVVCCSRELEQLV